jgi:hypothetical protein
MIFGNWYFNFFVVVDLVTRSLKETTLFTEHDLFESGFDVQGRSCPNEAK